MRFFAYAPRRPRHPLARALSVIIGLAVVGILMVFGLVMAGVLLVGGVLLLAIRQWKTGSLAGPAAGQVQPPRARPADVLEGEFVVLNQHQHGAR